LFGDAELCTTVQKPLSVGYLASPQRPASPSVCLPKFSSPHLDSPILQQLGNTAAATANIPVTDSCPLVVYGKLISSTQRQIDARAECFRMNKCPFDLQRWLQSLAISIFQVENPCELALE
jgi:hypothetical protein